MLEGLVETGYVPDFITRLGARYMLGLKTKDLTYPTSAKQDAAKRDYILNLKTAKIALNTEEANEQHYELPTRFFQLCLGKRLKYSSSLFERGAKNLDEAEEHMLELYCERAQLEDGLTVLDLGCGWGSLSLYLAEKYPNSQITGLSNSSTQREFIMDRADQLGLKNLTIITADMNEFQTDRVFDRVMSIEMFEHMKNYYQLFEKVSKWVKPDTGRMFVHVFAHKSMPYDFTSNSGWMGKYFFTGGTMPCQDLFMWFQEDLQVLDRWTVSGSNYEKTSNEWLRLMDENKAEIMDIFTKTYGKDAYVWFQRWRMFYLGVAEVFGYNGGNDWVVMHYLFKRK
ncbi:hypothetical protein HDV04_001700 [Boothiomyces sp. JEL0838]|nr:hypothetical protein HDV04_001700 [Boothiomyces sp. JEL0838]